MTPGLAGFVASGDDAPEWAEVLAGVMAALAQGFEVVPERDGAPGGARRRTWFDTFDWRLYRAGLVLEHMAARGGGELRVTSAKSADAGEDTAQPVTGWQASRPHLVPDLPNGPVADRVAALVWPRALLPAVTVSSSATVSRLLNEDGKTVARIVVEQSSVTSGRRAALPPRLTVTEVRGYLGQARRAARIVALSAGVHPVSETVFAAALRAVGRRPGDYSNKVDAPITLAMSAAEAAATIMLRLLDTVEANVAGVLRDTDTEFLHDLRVSVRRTRSALKLFGDALTAPALGKASLTVEDLARFAAEFKWIGDMTTPTRDLDVHLLDFEETAASLRAAKPDDLEPFRGYLEQRRVKEFRTLARGLRSSRFTQLMQEWRAVLTKACGSKPNERKRANGSASKAQPARSAAARPAARTAARTAAREAQRSGGSARELAVERTRRAFAKVAKRGAAITPASPHESLHDLRKRAKELRYALEFFAPLHDAVEYGKVIGDLKRLQDCLGEFQDTEVQVDEIRALAAAMLAADEAPAVTLLAMGELTAGLASRQAAARADFERRFAAFAGRDGQRRMAVLLRGGAG